MKNSELKDEMVKLQQELTKALNDVLKETESKLKTSEKEEIKKEIDELKELLKRLATGRIWIALFGKTNVGKSAIANSLIGDDLAEVSIVHDKTTKANPYSKDDLVQVSIEHDNTTEANPYSKTVYTREQTPWYIVDVPGIMGDKVLEDIAIQEAQRAHGHIFVIDEEPYEPEIKLFDLISKEMPNIPRIVFFNKQDRLLYMPKKDREIVQNRVYQIMRKYVKNDADIVYGSAQIYNSNIDEMVRQNLTVLEDRLYADTSTFGEVVNVYDPAKRAEKLSSNVKSKIFETRKKVARKIINAYGIGAIASSIVPFDSLIVAPGMFLLLVTTVIKIMGEKESEHFDGKKLAKDLLVNCGFFLFADFAASTIAEITLSFLGLNPFFTALTVAADYALLSYFKYKRTVIFGEALLLYIENGFSFGDNAKEMIIKAKREAEKHYSKLQSK